MNIRMCMTLSMTALAATFLANAASGAVVTTYTPTAEAEQAWEDAVGSWQTIDFVGLEEGTPITHQYRDEYGVVFGTDPFTAVAQDNEAFFPNDGFGFQVITIAQPNLGVNISFDTPLQAIAFDHPGTVVIRFHLADGTTFEGFGGSQGAGLFSGWPSDVPIIGVELGDFGGAFHIDDMRFVPIPGPAGFAFFAGLAIRRGGRRRRDSRS